MKEKNRPNTTIQDKLKQMDEKQKKDDIWHVFIISIQPLLKNLMGF